MAFKDQLLALKLPISVAAFAAGVFAVFSYLGPSLSSLVGFFWPLLLSTGFFLIAVAVLLRISPPPHPDASGGCAGEDIIDYVAGTHHEQQLAAAEEASTEERAGRGEM